VIRDEILPLVNRPSRYCGNEHNAVFKSWDECSLRVALAFPDLYEIGMSHQGLQIIYHIVNRLDFALAERVYAPDLDLEQALKEQGKPLFSLESGRPLADFDLLGITLPYELCYTNILTILDLAGLPLHSRERDESHPLVVAGGPCAFNPEPVADFFDAVVIGDGEEAVVEICHILRRAKEGAEPRTRTLERLAGVSGVYVPSFFAPQYDDAGRIARITPLRPGHEKVRRAVVAEDVQRTFELARALFASRVV